MKHYCARYHYRNSEKELVEGRHEFMATSNQDALKTAKNFGAQQDWRLIFLFTGSFAVPGKYIYS